MRIQLRVFLIMALVAGVITQTPRAGGSSVSSRIRGSGRGDAVIVWNAHAGVAATNACIAPLDDPFHVSQSSCGAAAAAHLRW
jgi:hypothetical protein